LTIPLIDAERIMNGIKHVVAGLVLMSAGVGVAVAQPATAAAPAARAVAAAAAPMRVSLEDAVRLGLENNLDIAVDRLEPDLAAARVSQAAASFTPAFAGVFGRSHQLQPPSSLLVGADGTTTDSLTSTMTVGQRLRWTGGTYIASWNASRTTTNSFISSFSPNLGSVLQLSFSQPLLRDLAIDSPRQQLTVSKRNKEISDTRFRETVVRTLADVKRAYWDLVAARASITVQEQALALARELVRTNTARVEVGQAPPLDLLSARAEQAQREENLVVAQVNARQAEDRLRLLVLDPNSPTFWDAPIEPVDSPPLGMPLPDLDTVVGKALRERQDLIRARDDLANAATSVKFYRNQRMPDLRVQVAYATTGLGGTRFLRAGGFPGTVTGTEVTGFNTVLNQVFERSFPSWSVGVNLNYPLGRSFEQAALANARLQEGQARLRLQNLEIKAARQLRQAAWQIEANTKRIETSRAARQFAEQRLEAEQKRFEVGMSTTFLVVQAQRDLAQVRNNELAAVVDYQRAIIDFESLQQAGPASGAAASTATISGASIASFTATPSTSSTTTSSSSASLPGGM
jgi:outer membrane protein